MPDLIGKTLGTYTILDEIGRGGMATVYKARDRNGGQTVAIKVLSPQLNLETNFKVRFKREAKILRGLNHPNIVPILDYGETDGLIYLVMPFMEVGTLRDRLKRGELGILESARLINQVATALQFAHEAGVIHRDVKPSNILLDKQGNARLSDFGVAHVADASLSLTGSALIGTPAYISPEQIKGSKVTHLSDQYSLGVILYRLCTGILPYDAETPLAILIKRATEPLPRPRSINPNIPDAIEAILIKTLDMDPAQRFESISELNRAFQNAIRQVMDPATGLIRPEAVGKAPEVSPTDPTSKEAETEDTNQSKVKKRWRLALGLALVLIACPLALLGFSTLGIGNASSSGEISPTATISPTFDLMATVHHLSTINAPSEGTVLAPGMVETAVAATLTAMATEPGGEATPTPTEGNGASPSYTPTLTPSASPSCTPTSPSSASATPTSPSSPSATPTHTPIPTITPLPTPTSTKTPSLIPTPTPDPCSHLTLIGYIIRGRDVSWAIVNDDSSPVTIKAIYLKWPDDNERLEAILLGLDTIWDQGDSTPPTYINSGWESSGSRTIGPDETERLTFRFLEDAASSGYYLEVTFNNGCTLEAENVSANDLKSFIGD